MPAPIPVLLERKLLPKVWGGRGLEAALGLDLPAGAAIGESWELYDRPEGSSALRGGGTLHELLEAHGEAVLGAGAARAAGGRFPLLIKYIDARDALSVQVHPDDAQAAEEGDAGKYEAWIVLHAGPRARIIRGFKPGVTRAQLEPVASSAGVEALLHSFAPRPGDVVHLPAGTVHAVGPDVVLFEVQTNSDVTYRLWDWGRPRETHVGKALRAVRFDGAAPATVRPQPAAGGGEWLVRDGRFRVRRFVLGGAQALATEGTFKIVNVLGGRATLGWRSGGHDLPLLLQPGDCALVPACIEQVYFSPIGSLSFLWSDAGEGGR
jgi:mannose-6-phosphate isomerase